MVFVDFVGGWSRALFGSASLFLAGAAAAAVVTFFTFLPSFLFILLGAPFIESTRRRLAFTAPLTAVTAAVVGVTVNLAVFFAWHMLWPQGPHGPFDAISAAIALFRFKVGVIPVVFAAGLAGLAVRLAS